MIRTRVGYCGGVAANPTYHNLGDHSESIQVDFDPRLIGYAELVKEALAQGNFGPAYSRQYRSVIFYHNDEQKRIAQQAGCPSLEPVGVFTRAEDYHQKYYLQQSGVVKDFYAMFPDDQAFTDATATMRANAIVGGALDRPRVEKLIPQLGVGERTASDLLRLAAEAQPGCGVR